MNLSPTFNLAHFLKHNWQKQPMIIRSAFAGFDDPIDEHELAGLAMEPDIDSRIITLESEHWDVLHGPFEGFDDLSDKEWTLLVQGVNLYSSDVQQLMSQFNFLPDWRKDDVMISYSTPGAGVGPHIDQYDVFIIQGKGTRRWQVGKKGNYQEAFPHSDLRQIEMFEPIIDEVLQPGDMIYIPPGYPHNGTAIEPCLNYSIGFRAPNQQELISDFAEFLYHHELGSQRYSDADIEVRNSPKELLHQETETFRALMKEALDSPQFEQWLTGFLSKNRYIDNIESDMSDQTSVEDIESALAQGAVFAPSPDASPVLWSTQDAGQCKWILSLGDEHHEFDERDINKLRHMTSRQQWPDESVISEENSLFFNQLLSTLVNAGYWYLVD